MALPGDFDFTVRYTKGEEKVCVLDRNPWLAKMVQRGMMPYWRRTYH